MIRRIKSQAAQNEARDIQYIIQSINDRNNAGIKIIESFREKFGVDILEARKRIGTSRGVHYDFDVRIDGLGWKHVEHKGSQKFESINPESVPWKAGVQFYNGGCEKYSVALEYAKLWYEIHILSSSLKTKWGVEKPIPTFKEFWKDCCAQNDPTSSFQKELKARVRIVQSSLLDERRPVIEKLDFDEKTLQTLKEEVSNIANEVLDQKDYWLVVHGNLETEFNVAWYPKYVITKINEVEVEKGKDIKFKFKCEGGSSFGGILRWGKGSGFSCLRVDLK